MYVRAADVTNIVQASGYGVYSVGIVAEVLNPDDDVNNHAGWTIQIVYANEALPVRNMSVYVGAEVYFDFLGLSGVDISNEVFAYVKDGATEEYIKLRCCCSKNINVNIYNCKK
ncbi:hypothetical protein [Clostridium sp. DL1XJH146]